MVDPWLYDPDRFELLEIAPGDSLLQRLAQGAPGRSLPPARPRPLPRGGGGRLLPQQRGPRYTAPPRFVLLPPGCTFGR